MKKIFAWMLIAVMAVMMMPPALYAAGVLADVGADYILGVVLHGDTPGNLSLKLFCTDVTPASNNTTGSYTECSCTGYSAQTLTRGTGWVITTGNDPSDAIYSQLTTSFTGTCTSPNTAIYGYYITDAGGTTLIGAEKLASPFTPANGYTLSITPKIVMSYGTPTT